MWTILKNHLGRGSKGWIRPIAWGSSVVMSWSLSLPPAMAGDPFRSQNPEPIGEAAEAAFNAMFREGNYAAAAAYLETAEAEEEGEPLVYSLLASLAYLDEDWSGLNTYANQTLTAAHALTETNPLRGHLYQAIGHFMEGVAIYQSQGAMSALGKLQQVYAALDKAKAIDPNDPELNLVQGFMDLQIAVLLPFSNPNEAVEQLEQLGEPAYLADWGIAVAYRDLKRFDEALSYVNRALNAAPDHPQLYYLRAQILRSQGNSLGESSLQIQAQSDFRRALAKSAQLPKALVSQIFREYCRNQNQIDRQERDCGALRQPIQATIGRWGPDSVPDLTAVSPGEPPVSP